MSHCQPMMTLFRTFIGETSPQGLDNKLAFGSEEEYDMDRESYNKDDDDQDNSPPYMLGFLTGDGHVDSGSRPTPPSIRNCPIASIKVPKYSKAARTVFKALMDPPKTEDPTHFRLPERG